MSLVNFKGYRVKPGVKWTEDKNTITITCYPKKRTYDDGRKADVKLTTKSWVNDCPTCRSYKWPSKGNLFGFGIKGKWFGEEGGIKCRKCDADFCGVTGRDTLSDTAKRKLTEVSKSSEIDVKVKENDKEEINTSVDLTKKEVLLPIIRLEDMYNRGKAYAIKNPKEKEFKVYVNFETKKEYVLWSKVKKLKSELPARVKAYRKENNVDPTSIWIVKPK